MPGLPTQRYTSALVDEITRLNPETRSRLTVTAETITVWWVIVSAAALLIDGDDERPLMERLSDLFVELGAEEADQEALEQVLAHVDAAMTTPTGRPAHSTTREQGVRKPPFARQSGHRVCRPCSLVRQHQERNEPKALATAAAN